MAQQGMFGNSTGFQATKNPWEMANAQYDFSGVKKGSDMLSGGSLNIDKFNPFQFSESNFGQIGNYGKSSDSDISNVYNKAMTAGVTPIMSQSKERMRQLGQGFGSGRASGAAQQQLQLRNAQQTGADIQGLSNNISAGLSNRMLTQDETARQSDWSTQNKIFDANRDRQLQQSNANFAAAGYNSGAAEKMSHDQMTRAQNILQYGMQLPLAQAQLNKQGMEPWNQSFDALSKGMFGTVNPGENQVGGK